MLIGGLHKCSTVDYPGLLSTVIFTSGCNMNCIYCHNWQLISNGSDLLCEEEIIQFLEKRRGLIDGVVLSGGEPTLQEDLLYFARKIKDLGFKLKLDTNGTRPEVLEPLIKNNLLDFIAMDIKASPQKYPMICKSSVSINAISKSIQLIERSGIDYEFRTTTWPGLFKDDYINILKWIYKAKTYTIQCCRTSDNIPMQNDCFKDVKDISSFEVIAKEYVENFKVRGFYVN
ncbi:anaerobic ribonucleoside-triphosphate reductase activating protein [Tepidanaerobacter syntrophicus]|uniref:Pyruvate formate lyase activating enzyme n=1 Tax=Tepidanaerobacter syntrophicus TaxID=224999 RepID=A0A0U9HC27_9FIRM|nr:anaerobic ribonucleoside-triphosphate reductase activating protein [Tepidanaerobacter syntrophicus]GAQ24154.1 pyruvate formate lyase activating enzyme [Tepidanaerobacter syntrophicus]